MTNVRISVLLNEGTSNVEEKHLHSDCQLEEKEEQEGHEYRMFLVQKRQLRITFKQFLISAQELRDKITNVDNELKRINFIKLNGVYFTSRPIHLKKLLSREEKLEIEMKLKRMEFYQYRKEKRHLYKKYEYLGLFIEPGSCLLERPISNNFYYSNQISKQTDALFDSKSPGSNCKMKKE